MNQANQLTSNQMESNVRSYCRQFPCEFDRAVGAQLWDSQGKRYLDFLAGCGTLNYGHNNPILKEKLLSYIGADSIAHSMDLSTRAKSEFMTSFHDCILHPREMDYVLQFPGPTGTTAVEAAMMIARKVTGRTNIICFSNGFHGVSLGSLSATGNRYNRAAAGLTLQGTTVFPYDGYLGESSDSIGYLKKALNDPSSGVDLPAAVIVETIQGEGGVNDASIQWLQGLEKVCREFDILLIVDDIQAGCGRAGSFFSFEQAGLSPDIITMAKALSGFGLPMSMVLIRRSLDVWNPGEVNGTFRGNNHAFVTASTALRHYWSDKKFELIIAERSKQLDDHLQDVSQHFPNLISARRGRGLMRGLAFFDHTIAQRITSRAFQNGLVIERSGPRNEVIKFLMPLTISANQLDEGMQIIHRAIAEEASVRPSKKLESII